MPCTRRPKTPTTDRHLARVIFNRASAKGWLFVEWLLLLWQVRLSPVALLKKIIPSVGLSLVLFTVIQGVAIFCWHWMCLLIQLGVLLLVLWRFVDIFLSNLSITFTSKEPANPIRTVIYSMVAYVQIGLSYAFFFVAWLPKADGTPAGGFEAILFSFGVLATSGIGHETFCVALPLAIGLVVSEAVLGLFFVVIILAQVAAWAQLSRRGAG